jgi:hypothetical protein
MTANDDELYAIIRDARSFNYGEGRYNFSALPSVERASATENAWQDIVNRMQAIPSKEAP